MLEDIELFRVRVRVGSDSPEAIVMNYLNSKQTLYPARDMVMLALITYWLPIAYRDSNLGAKENLERLIRDSIYRLQLHLQYLHQMLGEETLEEAALSVDIESPESQLVIKPQLLKAQEDTSSKPEANIAELEITVPQKKEWFNPMKSSAKPRL